MLSLVPNRAGVVEDESGCLFILNARVALMLQRSDDFLGIMRIHLTPKGLDVKGFCWATHKGKYTPQLSAPTLSAGALSSSPVLPEPARYDVCKEKLTPTSQRHNECNDTLALLT